MSFGHELPPWGWLGYFRSRGLVHIACSFVPVEQFGDRLGEIDLNPTVIDDYIVHFKIGLLTGVDVLELNESIL